MSATALRAVVAEDGIEAEVLAAALGAVGVEARVVVTVLDAILEAARDPPDIAVLDLSVPFDDAGPALSVDARLAILRGRWRGPLVLWSGRDDTAEVAARWGAAAVQKPADFRALAEALRAAARPPPT